MWRWKCVSLCDWSIGLRKPPNGLHSNQSRVEIEFGIIESNQSLTLVGINAEMTAEYLSLARVDIGLLRRVS